MATTDAQTMSAREAEVLALLGENQTNAAIARQLHISVRTVESHVSSLLRKLGAADRYELAARAEALQAPLDQPWGVVGLPERWTSFVGREAQIDEITTAIGDGRLVTLLGPGGVGKTTLATVVAGRVIGAFPAGGAFVDLVPVSEEFVVQAVAAALGVMERPQEPLEELVLARLRDGRRLLVLDNCEHVLDAVGAFVRLVLASCRDVVVVATSRERLGVAGERVVPVPPLTVDGSTDGGGPEAVALFLARADGSGGPRSADPDDDGHELAMVAEICRRLDGVPLAIELAAARSSALGVDGLLAGLDDHLRLLGRSNGSTDRHSSLRAVIDWSHDLLDDEERTLFRRLGVFVGAFDLASATEVAADGDAGAAIDLIGRLTDKSLLVHRRDPSGSRWRMLDTVRAYAREHLAAAGEYDEIQGRHLVWAAGVARQLEADVDGSDAWRASFDVVVDDLRSALHQSRASTVGTIQAGADYELALTFGHLAYARRFLVEARDHYATAVDRAPSDEAAAVALRAWAAAAMAEMRGATAFDLQLAAAERAEQAGDLALAALAVADAASIGGRCPATFTVPPSHEELCALVERSRSLAPAGDLAVEAHVMVAAAWNGRPGLVEPDPDLADAALALALEVDEPALISNAFDAVAAAANEQGRHRDSARVCAARLDLLDRLPRHDPLVGGEVADIFHMANESAMAAGLLDQALDAAKQSEGDSIGRGLDHFAATHFIPPLVLQGSFDEALVQAEIMRDGWERTGRPAAGWMAPAFYAVALVHGLRGDEAEQERWWELGQIICLQTRLNSFSLFAQPRVALHRGDLELARRTVVEAEKSSAGLYDSYARVMAAEVAVVADGEDASYWLDLVVGLATENDFVDALVTRALGRRDGDEALLELAVEKCEAVGARFERACTLWLMPARRAEAEAEFEAMGTPPPAI